MPPCTAGWPQLCALPRKRESETTLKLPVTAGVGAGATAVADASAGVCVCAAAAAQSRLSVSGRSFFIIISCLWKWCAAFLGGRASALFRAGVPGFAEPCHPEQKREKRQPAQNTNQK